MINVIDDSSEHAVAAAKSVTVSTYRVNAESRRSAHFRLKLAHDRRILLEEDMQNELLTLNLFDCDMRLIRSVVYDLGSHVLLSDEDTFMILSVAYQKRTFDT